MPVPVPVPVPVRVPAPVQVRVRVPASVRVPAVRRGCPRVRWCWWMRVRSHRQWTPVLDRRSHRARRARQRLAAPRHRVPAPSSRPLRSSPLRSLRLPAPSPPLPEPPPPLETRRQRSGACPALARRGMPSTSRRTAPHCARHPRSRGRVEILVRKGPQRGRNRPRSPAVSGLPRAGSGGTTPRRRGTVEASSPPVGRSPTACRSGQRTCRLRGGPCPVWAGCPRRLPDGRGPPRTQLGCPLRHRAGFRPSGTRAACLRRLPGRLPLLGRPHRPAAGRWSAWRGRRSGTSSRRARRPPDGRPPDGRRPCSA
ncbi:proteophosphoglycan ppg4 [Micromonospora aurantiaca]|nr:proteophosphoglycan ppg4 [Micromonospora aurantiaca]